MSLDAKDATECQAELVRLADVLVVSLAYGRRLTGMRRDTTGAGDVFHGALLAGLLWR